MNLQEHMEHEFELLKQQGSAKHNMSIILDFEKPIKKIIKIFSKQRHSGAFAGIYSSIISDSIKQLLQFETLSPLTGEDDEWTEIYDKEDRPSYQNKRNTAVFKENNIVNYIDGIVWQNIDNEYDSFTGSVENISSNIKGLTFPITPKIFRINVKKVPGICPVSEDCYSSENPSIDGVYHYEIVDKDDLKEVEKYYGIHLGEPDGDVLGLGNFEPMIREYIRVMRKSFPDYEAFFSFINDAHIVSKQIEELGGKLRSRQVLATLALPYLKYDN